MEVNMVSPYGGDDVWSIPEEEDLGLDTPQARRADDAMDEDSAGAESEVDDNPEARAATHRTHLPYLYETHVARKLDTPSPTVHFMPEIFSREDTLSHRLAVATCGDRPQHYITFYKLQIPCRKAPSWLYSMNEQTGELGGQGVGPSVALDVEYRLYHDGAVANIERWACNPCFIGTRSGATPDVNIFNVARQKTVKKRPEEPDRRALVSNENDAKYKKAKHAEALAQAERVKAWDSHTGVSEPTVTLTGLDLTGDSLDFAMTQEGTIAAGSSSGQICIWRLSDGAKGPSNKHLPISAYQTPTSLSSEVSAVKFNPHSPSTLYVAGAPKELTFLDLRGEGKRSVAAPYLTKDVLSAEWSAQNPTLLAVGDAGGAVTVVDVRNASEPLFKLEGHSGGVYSVKWCPHQPSLLASGAQDANVCLWDLRGRDEGCHPVAGGGGGASCPRELYFVHTGHTGEVGGVSWTHSDAHRGMVASVDMDPTESVLQIWRPRNNFLSDN